MKTNKHRTICAILCAALISASTFACLPLTAAIDTDITVSAANTSQPPKLNLTQLSLGKGESYKLSADQSVSWRTSEPKTLTVDKNGNVKAVGIGTAWITAKNSAGKESSCKITVKNAPGSVSVSQNTLTLGVGEEYSISAILPEGSASASRTFRSSNSSIVKMTKTNWTGSFKAVKTGTATVTVKLYNGREASCKVTVKKAPSNVELSAKSLAMSPGQTSTLSAVIANDAGCAHRTFSSSDSSIVKMTKTNWTGSFTAVKPGTAWVTVRTYNGKEASCKITVSVNVNKISLNKSSLTLNTGDSEVLTATIDPANATNKSVIWTSSNTDIAAVDKGKVTAKKAGTVTITVRSVNGKTAVCKVTVKESKTPEPAVSDVNSLSLKTTSLTVGDTATLNVKISPADATNQNITWTSSDTSVATVKKGKVTAKKAGTVTITAKSNNGKTASCKITIKNQTHSDITLNTTNRLYASMTLGQAKNINPLEKAVVCIGFDDYNTDCLPGVEYLNSQNLKSYLAVIPDNVKDNWSMAHACYDNGGEIVAHSSTTLTSENQTFELMNEKFVKIPAIIGENGFPVYGIFRAGGEDTGTENKELDEYYCRAAGLKYSDYYGTVNPYHLTRSNMTHRTLEEWQSYFDELVQNKGYVILYCHHLNGAETNAYPDGFTLTDLISIVSEIQKRDIDVMTVNEFADKYIYGISGTDAFSR